MAAFSFRPIYNTKHLCSFLYMCFMKVNSHEVHMKSFRVIYNIGLAMKEIMQLLAEADLQVCRPC